MSFVWEFIGVWKEQYFTMIRIQFPEFFRSAVLIVYGFVQSLPVTKAIQIEKGYDDKDHSVDSVECEILYEPPDGVHDSDVIIIHGLHGSTYKTWRQGVYECGKVNKIPLRKNISIKSKSAIDISCSKCETSKIANSSTLNDLKNKKFDGNSSDDSTPLNIKYNTQAISNEKLKYFKNKISMNNNKKYANTGFIEDDENISNESIDQNKNCKAKLNRNKNMNEFNIECDDSYSQTDYDLIQIKNNVLPENICDSNLDIYNNFSVVGFNFYTNDRERGFNRSSLSSESLPYRNTITHFFNDSGNLKLNKKNENNITKNCDCNGVEKKESNYRNKHSYEEYIKYCDVYGNYPLLVREFFFFIKFFLSFAKELISISKNIWNNSETKELSPCWPRDWLPIDCPNARVISINYTTFLYTKPWTKPCNRSSLMEKSLKMAKQLEELGVGDKPIVWAAHSKGGLFIKQIFVNSWRGNGGVSKNIFMNTHTMMFYSVPQHGSVLAHFFTLPIVKPSIEIVEIRTGSKMVQQLQNEFREALQAAHELKGPESPPIVISYTETIPTNMSGVLLQIVFPTSADPGVGELYGIPLDHRMICKFASRNSVLYKDFVTMIDKACKSKIFNDSMFA